MWQFLRKIGIVLLQDPAIPVFGIYPKGTSFYLMDTCSSELIAVLLIMP